MRKALQAAPGNWAFVLQEVESDSGHVCAVSTSAWGSVEDGGEKGVGLPDTLPRSSLKSSGVTASPSVSAAGCKEWLPFRTHSMTPPILTYFLRLAYRSSTKFRPFLQCVKVFVTFGEQRGEFSNNVVQSLTSALHCQTARKCLPEKGGDTELFLLGKVSSSELTTHHEK